MTKNYSCAIEISDSYIKILQTNTHRKNKRTQFFFNIATIRTLNESEIFKVFAQMLKEAASPVRVVNVIFPRRFATFVPLQLPTQSPEELTRIIDLQVLNWVPFTKDEIIYDYSVIHQNFAGYSNVLVVIINREKVKKYIDLISASGVRIDNLSVSSFGLIQWHSQQTHPVENFRKNLATTAPTAALDPAPQSPPAKIALIICIDHDNSEFCFCQGDKLLFSREVNIGFEDIQGAGKNYLLRQLRLTIAAYYRKNMGESIDEIRIVVAREITSELLDLLKLEYSMPITVIVVDINTFAQRINSKNTAPIDATINWSPTIGSVFLRKSTINLLPKEISSNLLRNQVSQKSFFSMAVICLLVLLFAFSEQIKLWERQKELDAISEQLKGNQPQRAKAAEIYNGWEIIQRDIESRHPAISLLDRLNQLTPMDVSLLALTRSKDDTVQIEGVSLNESSINSWKEELKTSNVFENIDIASTSPNAKTKLINFKLKGRLIVSAPESKAVSMVDAAGRK